MRITLLRQGSIKKLDDWYNLQLLSLGSWKSDLSDFRIQYNNQKLTSPRICWLCILPGGFCLVTSVRIQVYGSFIRFPNPTFPRFFYYFHRSLFCQTRKPVLKYLLNRERVLYYNVFFMWILNRVSEHKCKPIKKLVT